jgi:carboxypeptidase family protein
VSAIAGVVHDTSGSVLPGVTVEAASPALIEQVRTVVTDGEARYNVVDLRPGTYVVTFTLPGFSILRREGITLTSGFTATGEVHKARPRSPRMNSRKLASLSVMVLAGATSIAVAGQGAQRVVKKPAAASKKATATWKPSRTPDGQPDLQGVWAFNTVTPMERPKDRAGKEFLTEEEAAAIEKRANDHRFQDAEAPRPGDPGTYNRFWTGLITKATGRTSLIVDPPDGRIPPLTDEARKRGIVQGRRNMDAGEHADSAADRDPYERCIAREIPRTGGNNPGAQIVQSPGYVTILYEAMHDSRVIPLDGRPHVSPDIRLWNGDSRGRWEGQTLVVDTTNFSDKQTFYGAPQGQMHLIERFTRVDADTIDYEVTIDHPAIWTKPWTFVLPWWKSAEYDELFEYACHEGNYNSMTGMLEGARKTEEAAAKAAQKP